MTLDQRACLAAKLVPSIQQEAVKRRILSLKNQPPLDCLDKEFGRSTSKAAVRVGGVGWRLVAKAVRMQKHSPILFHKVFSGDLTLLKAERELREEKARSKQAIQASHTSDKTDIQIFPGDFRSVLPSVLEDSKTDLFLTDPPYPEQSLLLWRELGELASKKLKPGGFLVGISGSRFLDQVMTHLSVKLTYVWVGMLHLQGQTCSHPSRRMISSCRPVLIYARKHKSGSIPKPPNLARDVVTTNGADTTWHPFGQKVVVFKELIEWFSRPNDLVVDPFAGGGTVPAACRVTLRRCVATELEPAHFKNLQRRILGE